MIDARSIPDFVKGEFVVNRRRLTVEWGHCDPAGIVFNPRYFEYFDWCCVLLFEAALDVTKRDMNQDFGLAGIPIVDARAKFLVPIAYDETVDIYSTVASLRRSSFEIKHILLKDGVPAVECSQTRVWCGPDPKNSKKLKSCAIPEGVIEKLSKRVVFQKN